MSVFGQDVFPGVQVTTKMFLAKEYIQVSAALLYVKLTIDHFAKKNFWKGQKVKKLPPHSPDITLIENLWFITKRFVYKNRKQCSSKENLWETIENIPSIINIKTINVDKIKG